MSQLDIVVTFPTSNFEVKLDKVQKAIPFVAGGGAGTWIGKANVGQGDHVLHWGAVGNPGDKFKIDASIGIEKKVDSSKDPHAAAAIPAGQQRASDDPGFSA